MSADREVIGLTGYAQHGKDTVAAHLVENYGYLRVSFADALKDLALRIDPIIGWGIDMPMETVVSVRLSQYVAFGWEKAKADLEVRRFLQELGTRAREVLGDDVWVDAAYNKVAAAEPFQGVVFSDVRFPNEAELVERLDGEVWRIERRNEDLSPFDNGVGLSHVSESNVADIDFDEWFMATSVPQLLASVDSAMEAV